MNKENYLAYELTVRTENEIMSGKCCEFCGIYFPKMLGRKAICKDCWKSELSKEERKNYHLAKFDE